MKGILAWIVSGPLFTLVMPLALVSGALSGIGRRWKPIRYRR